MTTWQSLLYCAAADVTLERIRNLVAVTGTEPLTVEFKEGRQHTRGRRVRRGDGQPARRPDPHRRHEPAGQDGTADVAIAVTPGWRDVGLATELLRMLAQAASEQGIHTFTGTFLADNRPVTALISEADEPANQVTSRGITEFSAPLPPGSRALGHDHEGHR